MKNRRLEYEIKQLAYKAVKEYTLERHLENERARVEMTKARLEREIEQIREEC